MAVDEFRTSRGESARERLYLNGLVRDLDRTERSIRFTAEFHSWVLDHANRTLPVLRGEEPVPDDTLSFLTSVYQASRSLEPRISRATYDDLISTGGLRLLRSESSRMAVLDYYGVVELMLWPVSYEADREPYRTAIRRLFPVDLQTRLQRCFPESPESCSGESSGMALAPLVRSVLALHELSSELTLSMQSMVARNFAPTAERTRRVRQSLEQELVDRQVRDSM